MKFFQSNQQNLSILGISSIEKPFNRRMMKAYLIYGLSTISANLFLILEANSFSQYTNSVFVTTALAMILICFSMMVFKATELYQFMDDCEEMVVNSK